MRGPERAEAGGTGLSGQGTCLSGRGHRSQRVGDTGLREWGTQVSVAGEGYRSQWPGAHKEPRLRSRPLGEGDNKEGRGHKRWGQEPRVPGPQPHCPSSLHSYGWAGAQAANHREAWEACKYRDGVKSLQR